MALNKQSVNINFAQGLDTKTDPHQVAPGKFLSLQNTIFDKGGLLQKRNGYGKLTALSTNTSTYVTTFNDNLIAIGTQLNAYSQGSNTWVNKADLKPLQLTTLPLVRSSTNQVQVDSAIASNGLICTVYTENAGTTQYKYVVADSVTGQNIIAPTVITPPTGAVAGSPRIFLLGNYFIIMFTNYTAPTYRLQYFAVPTATPTSPGSIVTISSVYTPNSLVNFDGVVANNALYIAWNGSDGGGAIRMARIDYTLTLSSPVIFAGRVATIMSVTADTTQVSPIIYASFYDSVSSTGYTLAINTSMVQVLAPTQTIAAESVANITSSAQSGVCTVYYEVNNNYGYDAAIKTHYIKQRTITQAGTLGTASILARSVGLASKSFIMNGEAYMLGIYSSVYQPSYFLLDSAGQVVAKLAYSNADGYCVLGLPGVTITGTVVQIPYLIKTQIQAVNKTQGVTNAAGVYSQIGLNLASFDMNNTINNSVEIGNNLNFPGGFLLSYDGYSATENGFFLWPESLEATTTTAGSGLITAQQYFYIATYEWADNQGNIFRSAPSVPLEISTTSAHSTNTIYVPTLRLTYKLANPAKIVLYRWSVAQQTYYQVTSISAPTLNDTTVDYVTITDTLADSAIIGNNILYTTGGVLENISAPAPKVMTLFNNRMFMIDAEDPNLLWFSKQVIESTPVEMSDLLTLYVAPSVSASGSTGPLTALAPLDDKLILFKQNAIYYISGIGPDNTGANSQYSDPIFITSTVGCVNQQSIVFMPNGLMFQSDKGIWLLERGLNTTYIGAPVQTLTQDALVQSAVNVPGTNQVRFTLDSGITLMYDYYYGQWGTFINVPAISSTLVNSLHTYINASGVVFQETPGLYLDNSNPVLMSFKTSWLNMAGVQGYERAYYFYMLGTYISPHKLQVQLSYDYNPSPTQSTMITPDNYSVPYGSDTVWGSTPTWGGQSNIEQWRVFLQQQKCESFQISINEFYDPTMGGSAGAGLTISGLNVIIGAKSGYPRIKTSRSVG